MWMRARVSGLCLLGLIAVVSACGGTTSAAAPPAGSSAAAELPASQCDKTAGLTVYSAQGYDSDTTKAFQAATGITTKLVDDSTGPLLAKIAAEGTNPQWDVFWVDGNVTLQDLDNHGYLLKWKSNAIANLTDQGKGLVPSDNAYYPGGITAAGAIVYNKAKAPAVLPADWADLLKPEFKNMTAANDPAFSGPSYPMIAGVSQVVGGEQQGKDFFTKLKANGLTIFQTNDPTLSSVKTGAKEFAIVQDSAYYGALAGGANNLGIIYPSSGVAALPSELGVALNGAHQACAEVFVDWVLSQTGQTTITHHDPTDGDTYFVDVVASVTPVVQRATSGIKWISLDVQKWASVEDEYKTWFHGNIVA
jgi:iron(III) transport system substrate-binding protein